MRPPPSPSWWGHTSKCSRVAAWPSAAGTVQRATRTASCDDKHAACLETAHRDLEAASEGGVRGVLFTGGGEPLVWERLLDALKYSSDLSMDNCMYTNGFWLGDEGSLARSLLSPQNHLVFVRASVNAMRRAVVRKHGRLDVIEVDRQIEGLAALLHARNSLVGEYEAAGRSVPSIQISTIIDRQNVEDLPDQVFVRRFKGKCNPQRLDDPSTGRMLW